MMSLERCSGKKRKALALKTVKRKSTAATPEKIRTRGYAATRLVSSLDALLVELASVVYTY